MKDVSLVRGRPRKTDPNIVLEQAMTLFWEHGFDATSMNDIARETGMAKPGLYANFGDKESLYRKALEHYYETYGQPWLDYLINGTDPLEKTLRTYLEKIASSATASDHPSGCFVINGLINCSKNLPVLEDFTLLLDQKRREAFQHRFARAAKEGDLPHGADPASLADFFAAQPIALGVMARAKCEPHALSNLIETALSLLEK